jgi:hypothetical protein
MNHYAEMVVRILDVLPRLIHRDDRPVLIRDTDLSE